MLRVVICGSYHRDNAGLKLIFRELESHNCRILSPISLEFEDINTPIVKTIAEQNLSIRDLELFHLRAIADADFIWLHAPLGHVGISASYELGYANALGKTVFCKEIPRDEMLQAVVTTVDSVFGALLSIEA